MFPSLKALGGFRVRSIPKGLKKADAEFLMRRGFAGEVVYDIGAYKGYYTMFFSRTVGVEGRVVAFEPHPKTFRKLTNRVKWSRLTNVTCLQVAIGREREERRLAFRSSGRGTASLAPDLNAQILSEPGSQSVPVEMDSLDRQVLLHGLPGPGFVKIDVEGLEWDVLVGMRDTIRVHRPALYIEMHGVDPPRKMENAQKVVEFLSSNGFSIHHVESKTKITPLNHRMAGEGHLYCTL